MYEKAIEIDPDYALAHARLAYTHAWMYRLRHDLSENRLVAAKRAVDHALALDPDLPEAHLALGVYYYWGRMNYERAIESFTPRGTGSQATRKPTSRSGTSGGGRDASRMPSRATAGPPSSTRDHSEGGSTWGRRCCTCAAMRRQLRTWIV